MLPLAKVKSSILAWLDARLFALLSQRVALTLLALAASEVLTAPFAGMRWAIFALATAVVAIGLIAAGAGLWASAIGTAVLLLAQSIRGVRPPVQ